MNPKLGIVLELLDVSKEVESLTIQYEADIIKEDQPYCTVTLYKPKNTPESVSYENTIINVPLKTFAIMCGFLLSKSVTVGTVTPEIFIEDKKVVNLRVNVPECVAFIDYESRKEIIDFNEILELMLRNSLRLV